MILSFRVFTNSLCFTLAAYFISVNSASLFLPKILKITEPRKVHYRSLLQKLSSLDRSLVITLPDVFQLLLHPIEGHLVSSHFVTFHMRMSGRKVIKFANTKTWDFYFHPFTCPQWILHDYHYFYIYFLLYLTDRGLSIVYAWFIRTQW